MKYRTPSYAAATFDVYVFEKNLHGDIISIYDDTTTKVVTYTYDAWSNTTVEGAQASTVGVINSFRYRGYYYDNETCLYYLQSRYYNSGWGRFVNADRYISTGFGSLGYNMFAYCNNNPSTYRDDTGATPIVTIGDGNLEGITGTYNDLRKITAGNSNYQVHHIIEKRFYAAKGFEYYAAHPGLAPSVIIRTEMHTTLTQTIRSIHPYGQSYGDMKAGPLKASFRGIYRDLGLGLLEVAVDSYDEVKTDIDIKLGD